MHPDDTTKDSKYGLGTVPSYDVCYSSLPIRGIMQECSNGLERLSLLANTVLHAERITDTSRAAQDMLAFPIAEDSQKQDAKSFEESQRRTGAICH